MPSAALLWEGVPGWPSPELALGLAKEQAVGQRLLEGMGEEAGSKWETTAIGTHGTDLHSIYGQHIRQ